MKFLVDTQLPPVLSSYLRRKGFDAVHTTHFPNGHLLADNEIENIALEQDRIIITKDSDFPEKFFINGSPPKVLHLDVANIRNNDLVDLLETILKIVVDLFDSGANLIKINQKQIISY